MPRGIQFMVIAAPRSGTAWCANWLTTDTTLCLHDPFWTQHYSDLEKLESKRTLGLALTGASLLPKWLNTHPARKVILRRPEAEVNASLRKIGLPDAPHRLFAQLDEVAGMHVGWNEPFENPEPIYEYLLRRPLDRERHDFLVSLEVQTDFENIQVDPRATARLMREVRECLES